MFQKRVTQKVNVAPFFLSDTDLAMEYRLVPDNEFSTGYDADLYW